MAEGHEQARCMCSDLVDATWQDPFGNTQNAVVNLEEIGQTGALLQFETPVPIESPMAFQAQGMQFPGRVLNCRADFIGYLVEMEFDAGHEWTRDKYEPEHFFDPRSLLKNKTLKAKNDELLKDCLKRLSETAP